MIAEDKVQELTAAQVQGKKSKKARARKNKNQKKLTLVSAASKGEEDDLYMMILPTDNITEAEEESKEPAAVSKNFTCTTCNFNGDGLPLEFDTKAAYAKHLKSLEHKKCAARQVKPDVKRNRVIEAAKHRKMNLMGSGALMQEKGFRQRFGMGPIEPISVCRQPPTFESYWD